MYYPRDYFTGDENFIQDFFRIFKEMWAFITPQSEKSTKNTKKSVITVCDIYRGSHTGYIKIDYNYLHFSYKMNDNYVFSGYNEMYIIVNLVEMTLITFLKGYVDKNKKLHSGKIYNIEPVPRENRLWCTINKSHCLRRYSNGKLYWQVRKKCFYYHGDDGNYFDARVWRLVGCFDTTFVESNPDITEIRCQKQLDVIFEKYKTNEIQLYDGY